ncbi:MAG: tetratricopeptide repeat protein [Helicobacteraceae bacterium]|jgi:tetratricopeptide (TPR) repeat protein|nr:tetratricopeptide repeat protein [Helicobacteraceae bacterium]
MARILIVLFCAFLFACAAPSAFRQGIYAYESGNIQEAIKQFSIVIKEYPKNAYIYYMRGNAHRNLGDYQKAIADYTRAIKLDPNYADAYYNRAGAYNHLGYANKAIADYGQTIKIDPNYIGAYNNRGLIYFNLTDYEKATQDAKKTCELGRCNALEYLKENNLTRYLAPNKY